jgi:cyclase
MPRFIHTPTQVTDTRLSRRSFLQVMGAAAFSPALQVSAQRSPQISSTDLGGGLFLFQGAGCNVVAMRGDDGALMIDGGLAADADALLRAVKEKTGNNRIHTLINTHWHPEQTGCNEAVGRDGGVIIAHEKTRLYLSSSIMSTLFDGKLEPLPKVAQPTKTTQQGDSLKFAGKQVDYAYLPQAHTDGDLYVHFPELNILVAGGVASAEQWPLLDYRNGAWYGGRVRAFERLAKLVQPDTRVVPANGRLMTGHDIQRHNDIYQKLFTEMIAYMNMGFGADEVVATNPLKPYESELGSAAAFLNGAYRSMQIAYVPD